jgi:hypothetical protein
MRPLRRRNRHFPFANGADISSAWSLSTFQSTIVNAHIAGALVRVSWRFTAHFLIPGSAVCFRGSYQVVGLLMALQNSSGRSAV